MSKSSISRRRFLSRSAGAGAGLAVAGFPGIASARNVNNRINVGIVGPGGRGTSLLKNFFADNHRFNAHLTAIADLWSFHRDKASKFVTENQGHAPKVYSHHEEILADADLDAVIIATPDHAHAQVLTAAAEAGKDAYCEKPMSNVLEEANDALDAVRKAGTIVQIGTQRRSWPKYRQAAKMIADGIIGDVVKVDLHWSWYSAYRWAKSDQDLAKIKESDVDWNTWLMGKQHRPFDPRVFRCFRLWKDFSSGIIDQWMTHGIDMAHMLTGTSYPLNAVAHGGIYAWKDWRENADTIEVSLEYEKEGRKFLMVYSTNLANGYGKATQVHGTLGSFEAGGSNNREDWSKGRAEPSANPNVPWHFSGRGVKAEGRVGDQVPIPDAEGERSHVANWLDAVRSRDSKRLHCPVEAGYGHSVACIMSTDSFWSGRRMTFDPVKRTIQAG
jgi:predicted dehydrogenase